MSNIIRFIAISIFYPVFYGLNKNITFKDIGILALSGMKGEITVVLSLSTKTLLADDYNKTLLILLTNVVLSIILNSILLELYLQKYYNKNELMIAKKQLIKKTVNKVTQKSKIYLENFKEDASFLNNANWNLISEKIGINSENSEDRELINMEELFLGIMEKKNRYLYIKGVINSKTYNSIKKIIDFQENRDIFDSIIINRIHEKIDEDAYFECYKKNVKTEQYLLIISFLLLIDLSFKKLHNFINNQILELDLSYKYNMLRDGLIQSIKHFEENYKDLTYEVENNHATKMLMINQINNLKEIYKDGEIDKVIYEEILSMIIFKYKNIN